MIESLKDQVQIVSLNPMMDLHLIQRKSRTDFKDGTWKTGKDERMS